MLYNYMYKKIKAIPYGYYPSVDTKEHILAAKIITHCLKL